jgi:hypothetical protein
LHNSPHFKTVSSTGGLLPGNPLSEGTLGREIFYEGEVYSKVWFNTPKLCSGEAHSRWGLIPKNPPARETSGREASFALRFTAFVPG